LRRFSVAFRMTLNALIFLQDASSGQRKPALAEGAAGDIA